MLAWRTAIKRGPEFKHTVLSIIHVDERGKNQIKSTRKEGKRLNVTFKSDKMSHSATAFVNDNEIIRVSIKQIKKKNNGNGCRPNEMCKGNTINLTSLKKCEQGRHNKQYQQQQKIITTPPPSDPSLQRKQSYANTVKSVQII